MVSGKHMAFKGLKTIVAVEESTTYDLVGIGVPWSSNGLINCHNLVCVFTPFQTIALQVPIVRGGFGQSWVKI